MLDSTTKRRIDACRNILVGKVPDPKSQVEQITIALIYKFMDDMDAEAEELGGQRSFFTGEYARYGWARLMAPNQGGFEVLALYSEAIGKMNENPGIPALFRDIFRTPTCPIATRKPCAPSSRKSTASPMTTPNASAMPSNTCSRCSAARATLVSSARRATSSTSWSMS